MGNEKSILSQHGYILLEEIEKGNFSKTLRVKKEKNGKEYRINKYDKSGLQKLDSVKREVTVLKGFKHQFIVQYLEQFEDSNVYLVMEYCEGGDLSNQIEKQKDTGKYFPEDQILAWFVEICLAVAYVHEENILHRDIKPENIFLDKNGTIRLGDFGLENPHERSSGYARTFCYRSPEIIEEEPYGNESDVWALGCVLYELCELKRAFPEENLRKLFNKIVDGPYPSISGPFLPDLRNLVRDLLQKNPADRPSASDILKRPVFRKILIQKTKGIQEELQQKLKELDGVADGLERVHFGTTVGSLAGGVIGAAGGITTIVGVALAPVTLGASLIVTGVGIAVAAAGGVTGAASNVTKMVNENTDRNTIENIIHECEAKIPILVTCRQSIDKGFEDLDQCRALNVAGAARVASSIGALGKLPPGVQVFKATSQAVRLAQAAEVVTGVFAGLFLALDIYFIVDDSREIHAIRQQLSNNYTKFENESKELPQASSAEEEKPLKTMEFIKMIRGVSTELQKFLNLSVNG